MGLAAIGLLLVAALAHASWNLLAKRAGGGYGFVWLYTAAEVVFYLPAAAIAWYLTMPSLGGREVGLIAGSTVLHCAYFLLLQRGYATGELSLVYPVARGLAPLLTLVGAIILLGEQPSWLATLGVIAVALGVMGIGLTGRPLGQLLRVFGEPAMLYAIATASMIASYSVWDGFAMQTLVLSPIIFQWGSNLGRLVILTPWVIGRSSQLLGTWSTYRREILGVALLAPLAYILVLWAFTLAPVSLVAPAREFSIVIATAFGVFVLRERGTAPRLVAASVITAGVVLLGIA